MAATMKSKRSKTRQRNARSQDRHKAKKKLLVRLKNGVYVPAHMVTPLNPVYKGVQFLRKSKKKAA